MYASVGHGGGGHCLQGCAVLANTWKEWPGGIVVGAVVDVLGGEMESRPFQFHFSDV